MLGNGEYVVVLQHRGGEPIDRLRFDGLTFGRAVDTVTEATVQAPATRPDTHQGQLLASLTDWKHELSIVRDGDEVWVGPLLKPRYSSRGTTVMARDLFQWFERRWLPTARDFVDVDLGAIFHLLARDAYDTDPSPNFDIDHATVGVTGSRSIDPAEQLSAGDVLRDLANDAVDYVTIGRHVRVGGGELHPPALPKLTAATLLDAELEPDGLATATQVGMVGATAGSDAVEAATVVYGGGSADRGLLQRSFNNNDATDASSVIAAAKTRWDALHEAPQYLTGQLSPRYPITFAQLVPGALVPVEMYVGVRPVVKTMRLGAVGVSVTGKRETVRVTLIPVGTESLT